MAPPLISPNIVKAAAVIGVGVAIYKKLTVPKGAEKPAIIKTSVNWAGEQDLRVKLRVPSSYLQYSYTNGYQQGEYKTWSKNLQTAGGIIFPYTPSISYDTQASYTPTQLMHSNYAYYSYKNSAIGQITLNAKLTVQNDDDAMMYLSIVHLLRSLTKMKFGTDTDAGAPPPVCRLDGYGDFMLKNVPVVVSSFKLDLPDSVDYYRTYSSNEGASYMFLGDNSVPTVSTLAVSLLPVYSRNEQLSFGTDDFRDNNRLKKGGFL
jgi:hypothetical protein